IHAWLDGALDAEESARVEEHVAQCATCSAAVAEARGFAAGASRILTALDQTPGGVAPRSATFDVKPRRSPSLWGALHLTPARGDVRRRCQRRTDSCCVSRGKASGAAGGDWARGAPKGCSTLGEDRDEQEER